MFHVEISAGMHRARVFNLNHEDLTAKVVEPWLDDKPIEMGDREWAPRDSSLKILEGKRMETPDLSFGQGWANAERQSQDVTRQTLQAAPPPRAPDAYVVATDAPGDFAAAVAADHGGEAIEWAEAQRRMDGRNPEVAAVILVVRRPGAQAR